MTRYSYHLMTRVSIKKKRQNKTLVEVRERKAKNRDDERVCKLERQQRAKISVRTCICACVHVSVFTCLTREFEKYLGSLT